MSTNVKWGLITGMVYVIFSLVSNLMGVQQGGNMMLGMLMNVLIFGGTFFTLYLGIKETRDQGLNGYLTPGQAIRAGLGMALIAALISGVFSVIYMKFIDPEMASRIMAAAEAQLDARNIPEDQREFSRKISGFMLNPVILIPFTIIWICFWGLIKAAIAGQMLKNPAPPTIPTA